MNNKVVQVTENEFPVAKDLTWMDAPIECKPGWQLINGVLVEEQQQKKPNDILLENMPNLYKSIEAIADAILRNNNANLINIDNDIQRAYDIAGIQR